MTAVVVDGQNSKEYRQPTAHEIHMAEAAEEVIPDVFAQIPSGLPEEPTPQGASRQGGGSPFTVFLYGLTQWKRLFTPRQLLALGTFVAATRAARDEMASLHFLPEWIEGVGSYLAVMLDRLANQTSSLSRWNQGGEKIEGTFARFALPILWDFADTNPLADTSGAYLSALEWVSLVVSHTSIAAVRAPQPAARKQSAIQHTEGEFDAIVTDPPYYDAIAYSDLMDYFYVWLRRSLRGISAAIDAAYAQPMSPKWCNEQNDGELIDDASRHDGDKTTSKAVYEDGMARAFQACAAALKLDGKMVVVFANKQPDAWEALVSALVRSGFVVDGSWPIQPEMNTRMRAKSSPALASSVWLVCKKRPETARPGWDNKVLEEMRANIATRLREFWDAGI